jgi:hypothetical protein
MQRDARVIFNEADLSDLVALNNKLNELESESAIDNAHEKEFRKNVLDSLLTQALGRDNKDLLLMLAYRHSFFNRHRYFTAVRSSINSAGAFFNAPEGFSKNTIETHSQQRIREHMEKLNPNEGIKGRGYFRAIEVHFSKKPDDAKRQAIYILDHIRQLRLEEPELVVGLTYSANENQTIHIRETYQKGEWNTQTNGSNQATVIAEIEKQLATDYQDLQSAFRILPITSIPTQEQHKSQSGRAALLTEDLEAIRQFTNEPNHVVLAWQNQLKNDRSQFSKYAIGGGVVDIAYEDNHYIQACLTELRTESERGFQVPKAFSTIHENSTKNTPKL